MRDVEAGEAPRIGRRVAIYGGGNTALDAARTVKRLGAEEACIIYRRSADRMPAHAFEVQEATEEGIQIRWLRTIQRFDEGKLVLERMELDADGKLHATGEFDSIEADTLVLAVGQNGDLSILERVDGVRVVDRVVEVDDRMMTGQPGLFAGGDMVPSQRTIAVAADHGKKAARNIDAYLRGSVWMPPPASRACALREHQRVVLHRCGSNCSADAREHSPKYEVRRGARGPQLRKRLVRPRRCLSCGNCFECDNCYGVCPDNAIVKQGPGKGFRVDLDFCKGCGMCATECPCGAIRMVDEKI